MRRNFLLSQIFAFLTVLFWSSAYVFTKVALQHYSFSSLAFLRCAIAAVCLGGVVLAKRSPFPGRSALPRFLLAGATGFALYILIFNKGSATLNPTTSCIVISTSPIITAFLAQAAFGEKLRRAGWYAIALAFCGILVMTLWDGSLLLSGGIAWIFAAAVLISVYNLLQRSLSRRYSALTVTTYSFLAATLLLLPFSPEAVAQMRDASTAQLVLAAFLGVCPSAAAYLCWAKALAHAPSTGAVSNYMFLTPFLALLLDYAVTGQLPGTATFVGGAIILSGLWLFVAAERKK